MTTERDPDGAKKAADFWLAGLSSLVEDQARELDELRAEVSRLRAELGRLRAERDPTTLVPVGR